MSDQPRVLPNPYVWSDGDYLGRQISVTVAFDATTRNITGITVFRDPNCLFTHILIGVGPDGPDTTDKAIAVPSGTTILSTQQLHQLSQRGLSTIDDLMDYQMTAGL